MWREDVSLLVCPACRSPLDVLWSSSDDGALGRVRGACSEVFPVIAGLPRLLLGTARESVVVTHPGWFAAHGPLRDWSAGETPPRPDIQLVHRFDREWKQFADMRPAERTLIFERYFDLVQAKLLGPGNTILDAGCGGGRWAVEVASRGGRVIALDLGQSIELAARHVGPPALFVQADIRDVPLAARSVDLAYSLGVLHHIEETDLAVHRIVETIKPGGWFLIYLYYALDGRGRLFRAAFALVDRLRRVISSLPQLLLVPITTAIAGVVYLPLARLARVLEAVGLKALADRIPLRIYSALSFRTMRNDSLDRFGTKLEKRYRRDEVIGLLERAGLEDIRVSEGSPYWHAVGRRPTVPGLDDEAEVESARAR